MTRLFCVCCNPAGQRFIKSGDDRADVLRRGGPGTTIEHASQCPALAVQAFCLTQGEEVRITEPAVTRVMAQVNWVCADGCTHTS